MTALAEEVDDRFAGIDIDSLLNRAERRPFTYGRKKTLYEAPEFIQKLQGEETVLEGQSLCIDCKVAGFPVPTLRWFKDDEEIIDHQRIHVENNGMGSYSLIIACVNKGDEAAYRCRAENVEGATSSFFFLSVKAKPKSQKKKDPKSGQNRRTVSFPPMFATIVEKVEEEEKQGQELQSLPPSPMTDFYYALTLKSRQSWPSFVGDWAFANGRPDKRRTGEDGDHSDEEDDEEEEQAPAVDTKVKTGGRQPEVSKKPPAVPKKEPEPESQKKQEGGKEEKGKILIQRRRRPTPDNSEAASEKEKQATVTLNKDDRAKENEIKENSTSSKSKDDNQETQFEKHTSKYERMKEELLLMEKDLERKLQAKKKRDEEEQKRLEEKKKQETMAKIEADKARMKEDEKRRLELRKQLEEDKRKQEEEDRKAAEKLKAQQNGTIGGVKKDEAVRKNGPAALAMFQNLMKPEDKNKIVLKVDPQKANVKTGETSSTQPNKLSVPLTPMDAMRQREQQQIDNLKQREKQQIEELRKREQKQLDELRAKRQPPKTEISDAAKNKDVTQKKQISKAEADIEKKKAEEEKQRAAQKEKEEKAKVQSQIAALRGKELQLREELGAKESQQREELRLKDIRLREDMRQNHMKNEAEEQRKKEEAKKAKEKEEEEKRMDKKKELIRKEQLRRQYEEETRQRQASETKQNTSSQSMDYLDEDKKVYKRDYSFQDLRKCLETQLGGHVMNEEEHKYWDDILQKHNYSISDVKKTFETTAKDENPSRMRSRRNSVEESELLKLKRSGSISDLRESYTKSLGRPKKKALDPEKRQKDEMFLKRAASISDLRHQFLEVAHKPPSGVKHLGVSGKQEAEITIRNKKSVSDTIRPSEIRQRSKSPTPMPFLNTSSSSPSLQQLPENKNLIPKQMELMKLAGTVAAKRASFHEKIAERSQKENADIPQPPPHVAQKKNYGRDAYGSREIPVYKRAAGWSDDVGKTPEKVESENTSAKHREKSSNAAPAQNNAQTSSQPSTNPRQNYVSSADITDRPFLYNSARTTARKFTRNH
ncbi:trichohyalin [Biomphalaria glabrata]|nr:trichohyalin-like [Biomphalaria glabrata]